MLNEAAILSWIEQFFMIFLRTSAIFTGSPVFGRRNVPNALKIMLSIFLSYILIGIFPPGEPRDYDLWSYGAACLKEIVIGLTIGVVTNMFFSVAISAGQIIDMSIGFSMAQILDPQLGVTVPVMGNFLNMLMLLSFFLVNGHHMLIRILADTFRYMEPGNFSINLDAVLIIAQSFLLTIVMAVKIAMPVLAASFLAEMAMGLLMRVVPQMNMFVVGIPARLFLGLVLLLIVAPVYMELTNTVFEEMFKALQNVFAGMVAS